MAMKVTISFKDSEQAMYEFLISQLSPSIYIKQLMINDLKKSNGSKENENSKKSSNFLDF